MLKEFLEYIIKNIEPHTLELGNAIYSDRTLELVPPPRPDEVEFMDLTGLADFLASRSTSNAPEDAESTIPDYVKGSFVKNPSPYEACMLHVTRADRVSFVDPHVGNDMGNSVFAMARAHTARLSEDYLNFEDFMVHLNTQFVPTSGDHATVRELLTALSTDNEIKYSDDGLSQTVNVRAGIKRVGREDVPNPVMLAPYSTFPEITQPLRPFLLRMKQEGSQIKLRLFPVEDPVWEAKCVKDIKAYLRSLNLNFPII